MHSKPDKSHQNNNKNSLGELFIVATPIGNLKDITYRAIEVLSNVDLILCENTKNSHKLLSYYGINTKVRAYNDHSNHRDRTKILDLLIAGKNIALISDAGTPLISDPGFKLVRELYDHNIIVRPIPGATAIAAAICASAMPTDRFLFCGFLPNQKSKVEAELEELKLHKCTLIFYESPKRIANTIGAIYRIMGDRDIAIAREVTKLHEEFIICKCSDFMNQTREWKGEIVLMVSGFSLDESDDIDLNTTLTNLLEDHSLKDAVEIASTLTKANKKEIYSAALELRSRR